MKKKGNPNIVEAGKNTRMKKGDPRSKEISRMGVEARKKNAVERKKMRDELDVLLNIGLKKGKALEPSEIQSLADAKNINVSAQTAILISMITKSVAGDVNAATFIRDTVGEKPTDKVEVDQSLTIEEWAKNNKVKL